MHWLLPKLKGIKVLLYHHVWPGTPDYMTVTPSQLEEQFIYLKKEGYTSIFASTLVKGICENRKFPSRTFVLTFDDGYCNQVDEVLPLLKKFGFCASLFLIGEKVLMGSTQMNGNKLTYLDSKQILNTDPEYFEFGLHGYAHRPFSEMTNEELSSDIIMNQQTLAALNIAAIPVFAYPYGNRPGNPVKLKEIKRIFQEYGIMAAFRIGNGTVSIPVKDRFELKRIDISGFDNLKRFKIKLKKGKLKPF